MSLKYRLVLFIAPLLMLIFGGMLAAQYIAVQHLTKTHSQIVVHKQHVIIEQQFFSGIRLGMRSHVRDLTRNTDAKRMLAENQTNELKRILSPTAQRLQALGVADDIMLVNVWGGVVYHTRADREKHPQTYMTEPILDQVIEHNVLRFGLMQTQQGEIRAALAFPLYYNRQLIGAALYLKSLDAGLAQLAEQTGIAITLTKLDNTPEHTTDEGLWQALIDSGASQTDDQVHPFTYHQRSYSFHRHILKDMDNTPVAALFLTADTTETQLAQLAIYRRVFLACLGLLVLVTILLYWYIQHAFKPLHHAIKAVNDSAEGQLKEIQLPKTRNDEVGQLTKAIVNFHRQQVATINRVQAANRAKSQFLANMSHEIRTPLNAIMGITDVLVDSGLSPEQQQHCHTILGSATNLLHIINDVLDLSKIEAGQLSLHEESVNIRQITQDVVDMLAAAHRQKGLQFHCDIANNVPLYVQADAQRIRQILTNLIGNAAKFTAKGHVWTSFKVLSQEDGRVLLEGQVQDTGIGIPTNQQKDIFDKFQQGDNSSSRKYQGTGLGLAITREFIELMGGHIDVTSTMGKGSTFTFTLSLPLAQQPKTKQIQSTHPASQKTVPVTKSEEPLNILLVEDNPSNQLVAQHMLKPLAANIILANDGQEAVDLVRQNSYDLILMDCQMPVLDGYGATSAIRGIEKKEGRQPQLIIALTANVMADDREKCLLAGMDDFLPKPITRIQLAEVLQRHGLI